MRTMRIKQALGTDLIDNVELCCALLLLLLKVFLRREIIIWVLLFSVLFSVVQT